MCVCVRAGARAGERVCMCMHVRMCMYVSVCVVCVHARGTVQSESLQFYMYCIVFQVEPH